MIAQTVYEVQKVGYDTLTMCEYHKDQAVEDGAKVVGAFSAIYSGCDVCWLDRPGPEITDEEGWV
jgi:hypothetical protein